MAPRFVRAMCLSLAPGLLAVTGAAFGDGATGTTGAAAAAPPAHRAPRPFLEACARGASQYAARDFAGAAETFRKASDAYPQGALGPYLLGEALLASGDLAGAEDAWKRAAASSEDQPVLHARVLFVLADAKEREKRWNDAKAAWQAYRAWGERYPAANTFAASARARMEAIDRFVSDQRAVESVRRRIAETQDGGVFNDPTKGDAQR